MPTGQGGEDIGVVPCFRLPTVLSQPSNRGPAPGRRPPFATRQRVDQNAPCRATRRRRVPSTAQMFRGRTKTRLGLRQFVRLDPETSTPFRWLCTGSPSQAPINSKEVLIVWKRSSDREWFIGFFSRLPMPEPAVRRPRETGQLSERQRVLLGPAGVWLAEGTRRRLPERFARWRAMAGIGIGHLGGPGGPG